ncbi:hypothetical protein LSTR_LSTR016743, partial [Laodelphax striatellus]
FGAWASMACWVGLSVFAMLKLCRYHQLENMRVSMFRERQRLINEGMSGQGGGGANGAVVGGGGGGVGGSAHDNKAHNSSVVAAGDEPRSV